MTTDFIDTDNDKAWWAAPRFLISAVIVVLLVVVGLILALWPDEEDPSQAQPTPPATAGAASSDSEESVCGLDATGGTTLTKAPEVEWEAIGAIYAPASDKHGPGRIDEETGVRSCYSRTPEGALLATTNILTSGNDPQLLLNTIKAQALDGPGKDVAVGQVQQRVSEGGASTTPVEVAGFRLLSYTEDKATVEVVVTADDGTEDVYMTTGVDLVWTDGDWHVSFQDNGDPGPVSGQVSALNGYIEWSPHDG